MQYTTAGVPYLLGSDPGSEIDNYTQALRDALTPGLEVDVTSQLTLSSGSLIQAWKAIKRGRIIVLNATMVGPWAGGTWASKDLMNIPAGLIPAINAPVVVPHHPYASVEARTTGKIAVGTSQGGIIAGTYPFSLVWILP